MKNNTIKAVIICRVSSKEQEDTGYSLDAQEKLLTEYAVKNNFNVVKVYKISESASGKQARKKFNEILQFIKKNKVNLILAEKIDRLTRNLKDASIINDWVYEEKNNEVHFVKENFIVSQNTRAHENLVWDMKVAIARFYTNNLSEEVRKGQKEKLAQGGLPQKPPTGYKTIGDKGHKIHIIEEETAPHIKKMFELYATGNYSLTGLEDEMYKIGLRSRNGKKILQSRIYELLQDPFYYGKMRWKGQIYPAIHEPLISKDLFEKAQSILKRRGKTHLSTKHNSLFKSKIFCDGCGGVLSWELQKEKWYGHCNNHLKSRHCPKKTYVRQDKVEEQIMPVFLNIAPKNEAVLKWIESIILEENAEQIKERETEIQRLNGLLLKIRKEKDKYFEATINKEVPREFCERKIAECKIEESALESTLDKVVNKSDDYQELRVIIHDLAFKASQIYNKAEVDEKRLLFSQLFTNFTQNAYEIKPNYNLACKYLLEWIPKLNDSYEQQKTLAGQVFNTENSPKYKSLLGR
ncbi:recombinase family protein [Candidatus Nomurabacteria bacterium]|nr:recombinase family protein [Candidatus Nomurabacteria bacterium]